MTRAAELVLSHRSERSVLEGPEAARLEPFSVMGRPRLATCSGVAWFHGTHLAVVNLYGSHLRIHRFDERGAAGGPRLELLHETSEGVAFPEDVAVSPDARWIAVTHSLSDQGITLRRLGAGLAPEREAATVRPGRTFHGARFAPDGRTLAFTDIGDSGHIEVVRLEGAAWETTCRVENRRAPLKPKSVAFSPDGGFVAVAWAPNAARRDETGEAPRGTLAVHAYDAAAGAIAPEPLAELGEGLAVPEMCAFAHGERGGPLRVLVADQAADVVVEVAFDAALRTLSYVGVLARGLPFPHGLDVSADGRWLAVTSYGDDTLRVFRISR